MVRVTALWVLVWVADNSRRCMVRFAKIVVHQTSFRGFAITGRSDEDASDRIEGKIRRIKKAVWHIKVESVQRS